MADNLFEALQKEIERVRDEVLPVYEDMPFANGIATQWQINISLARAKKAIEESDTVEMIRALEDLRGYKL